MDKYVEQLNCLHFDLLHIAQSYANDNNSPLIEPAHILRALLHKSAGLVNFIEDTLDSDYYYLVDWADMRIQQCDKSPYKMKGFDFSHETKSVIKEQRSYKYIRKSRFIPNRYHLYFSSSNHAWHCIFL